MASSGSYDVVVVGAGLSGAIIASRLAQEGLQVVVLEARREVGGTAMRSPGLAILGTPEPFTELADRLGEAPALRLWELTQVNLERLMSDLRSMSADVESVGSLRLAADVEEAEDLRESATRLAANGYAVGLEDDDQYGDLAALSTAGDIRFSPQIFIQGLLSHDRISLKLDAEVHSAGARAEGGIAVSAHKSYLWADKVIFANGMHLARFAHSLEPILDSVCVHTVRVRNTNQLVQPLIIDQGRISFLPNGEEAYLAGWGADEQEVLHRLVPIAQQLCPSAVVYDRSTDWVSRSIDGLPVVGRLHDQSDIYFAAGLGPWGLSLVPTVADEILNLVQGDEPPGLFDVARLT